MCQIVTNKSGDEKSQAPVCHFLTKINVFGGENTTQRQCDFSSPDLVHLFDVDTSQRRSAIIACVGVLHERRQYKM